MNWWITAAIVGVVIIVTAFFLIWGPPADGVERLRERLISYGPWAVLVSAALMIGQAIIAPLPANVITITNSLVFGPLWGAFLSWSTMLMGASLCFALSRYLGRPFTRRIVGSAPLENAENFFGRYGLQAVFIVRIMPFVPFDAISYAAGIVGVPFSKFLLATAVGIIPSVLVYSYVGTIVVSAYWWMLIVVLSLSVIMMTLLPRLLQRFQESMPVAANTKPTAAD